jgi:hypothetical protein
MKHNNTRSNVIAELFTDWRLEKSTAPKIIQVAWVCTLIGFGLLIVLVNCSFVFDLIEWSNETSTGFRHMDANDWLRPVAKTSPTGILLFKILFKLLLLFFLFYGLLWTRILFELFLAIFNTASTMNRIEINLQERSA